MSMKRISTLVSAAALMSACTTAAQAQHSVRLATEAERIENPLLDAVSTGGANILRVVADYAYETRTDRVSSRFSAGATLERSSNTALLASRNYPNLGYTWTYNWPTANLELRANLAESATRNTRFEELGRVAIDARARTTSTGARWNKELTERTQLTLNVADNRVRYDSALLDSYRELEMSSRISWEASERQTYFFEPGYERLTSLGGGPGSTQTRWLVGMSGELAPEWAVTAYGGQARTNGLPSFTSTLGGLRLMYTGNRLSSSVELARNVQPVAATSGYVRTEVLELLLGYRLNEGTRLSASSTRSRISGGLGGVGHISRLTLERELTERWSTTLAVEDRRYRRVASTSGRGWAIRAGLVYSYSEL